MRTVTFSDPGVARALKESFACAWVNKRRDEKFKDGLYAGEMGTPRVANGAGVTNVTSVFAAHDGTVIHAMPGFLDVAAFQRNLAFAQYLHDRLYEGVGRRKDSESIYAEVHLMKAGESQDPLAQTVHRRLAKQLICVKQWYPRLFDKLAEKT